MVLTFQKILSGCEAGGPEAWKAFLGDFTPVVFQLLRVYRGLSPAEQEEVWKEALWDLGANHFARLREFAHQAEREFCIDLRAFVLDRCASREGGSDRSRDLPEPPGPTVETVSELLRGLPLLDQEVLFLKLCGYSDATLETLLRITPAAARRGLERLRAQYPPVLGHEADRCLWPAAWGEVLKSARASAREGCLAVRQFIRVQEGGFSWYEKEPVEKHVCECLHCLERWIALREIWHWRSVARARSGQSWDTFLACLPLRSETKARKSLLRRIF